MKRPPSDLFEISYQYLEALIGRLPDSLRVEAQRIGFILHDRDEENQEYDTLGDYTDYLERITLYTHALHDFCAEESLDYLEQLEITYLHELGHHLGLSEEDVERRGLS